MNSGQSEGDVPDSWTVYSETPDPEVWARLIDDLDRWRQGDLLVDLPVTWLMPPGHDTITTVDNPTQQVAPASQSRLRVASAIICSQTCDIGGKPPGDLHPFIIVAPLISHSQIPSKAGAKLALKGRVGYLFPTVSPDSDTDEKGWFADLRFMMPLSKSVLLGRTPKRGFTTEKDSLSFSETIAQKFRRPALSEVLSDDLPRALEKFVVDNGMRNPAFTKVEQVRLSVLDGDRLNPERAQIIIFSNAQMTEAESDTWRRFEKVAASLFAKQNLVAASMMFNSASDMAAREYRLTVPIRCDKLGHTRYP